MQKLNTTFNTGRFIGQHCPTTNIQGIFYCLLLSIKHIINITNPSIFHSVYIYLLPCKHFQPFTLSRKIIPLGIQPLRYINFSSQIILSFKFHLKYHFLQEASSVSIAEKHQISWSGSHIPLECPVILYSVLLYSYLCILIPSRSGL